jgi:hypothetical protein
VIGLHRKFHVWVELSLNVPIEVILPEIIQVLPSLFDTICFRGQKAMAEIHNLRQNADDLWYLFSDSLT